MKFLTKNLVIHSVIFLIASFLFRYLISWSLISEYFNGVWIVAAAYFVSVFVLTWWFSILDKEQLPYYDVGFRFHLATFVIWLLVSHLWFAYGKLSPHEHIIQLHISSAIWAVFVLIHFVAFWVTRKNAIKGLKKTDLFE